MDGSPSYPDGFSGLPQDQRPKIAPHNHFLIGSGRIDSGELEKCETAINGINGAVQAIEAFAWAMLDRAAAECLIAQINEQIDDSLAKIKADIPDARRLREWEG